MVQQTKEIDQLVDTQYVPTALERRRSLLMYFFVGIPIGLAKRQITKYEMYHLKQATGWRLLFFFTFIASIFLIFLPWVRLIPVILLILFFIVWIIFVKQAWQGYYTIGDGKIFMPLFYSIGGWVLDMFDIEELEETETGDKDFRQDTETQTSQDVKSGFKDGVKKSL